VGRKSDFYFKGFDRGNCNNGGVIVPKSKRGGEDRRKPAIAGTNLFGMKFALGGNRTHDLGLTRVTRLPSKLTGLALFAQLFRRNQSKFARDHHPDKYTIF
jgi:hypothetical protein